MSPPFILHHYEQSPYAEKIRLMFGRAGMAWRSVLSPPMPPRPNVNPLAGGYRRIPVAQVGADVFCDTSLIATEIAQLTGLRDLAPESASGRSKELAERAEGDVFFAAITGVSPFALLKTLVSRVGLSESFEFVKDRAGFVKGGTARPPRGRAAAQLFARFVEDLEPVLAEKAFLSGEHPGYADFAVYHPLWLHENSRGAPLDSGHRHVRSWMDRIASLGHGSREELAPVDAFSMARRAKPRPLPKSDSSTAMLNRQVTVAPSDYGVDPVRGTLVAATADRLVLARDAPAVGRVHVHFPHRGYIAKPA